MDFDEEDIIFIIFLMIGIVGAIVTFVIEYVK